MWVVKRLRREGFHAYIVGGAVRDLLVGRTPNDFDVATDARPQQIKRLFRSARVIGRRFRIVHVYSSRDKYTEVTTFRSRSALGTAEHVAHPDMNNLFGTMEEDAERRDFTINALYYCPIDKQVIDYVGGYHDLRKRHLRTLGRADASFAEDPVRMLRAVKYASRLGFTLPFGMANLIRRMRESLLECSRERITEEVYKVLTSGNAESMLEMMHKVRIFDVIFPSIAAELRQSRLGISQSPLGRRLKELDAAAKEGKLLDRNDMFAFLFRELVLSRKDVLDDPEPSLAIQQLIRGASEPLFPSKKDLVFAADAFLAELRPHQKQRPPVLRAPRHHAEPKQPGAEQRTGKRRRRGHRGGRRSGGGAAGGAAAPTA